MLMAKVNDPSEVTDFNGFVALRHTRCGRTGSNTIAGATTPLAFQTIRGSHVATPTSLRSGRSIDSMRATARTNEARRPTRAV